MKRSLPLTGACSLLVLLAAAPARSSEFRVTPSIAVSEEANDNIRELPAGSRFELLTRAQPGLALHYLGPYTLLDAAYNLDYRYYARNTRGQEFNHAASLKGFQGFWENFLTLEASDTFSRVSLDIARDTTQESVLVNQTDQNLATVAPTLTWHPGGKSTLKTGYRFSDVRYWHTTTAIDKQTHTGFANYLHQLSDHLEFNAGYSFSSTKTETISYQEHDVSAGLRYEYGDKSFLFGSLGNSWLEFPGFKTSNLFWDVGVTHNLGLAVATLETKVQYAEDPLTLSTKQTDYSLKLDRAMERGRAGFSASYSEYEVTLNRSQDRKRLQLNLGGSYLVLPSLTGNLNLTGERLNRTSSFLGLPFHLVASGGLSYALGEGLAVSGTYTHISYRSKLDSSGGAIEVNRGILEVRKSF
jgi:hypothetical protein